MSKTTNGYPNDTIVNNGEVYGTLERLHNSIITTFNEKGVGLPVRQYFAAGDEAQNAWDCEQLTLNVTQVYLGIPGTPTIQPRGCDLAMNADFVVQLVRCVPQPTTIRSGSALRPPSAAALTEMTHVQGIDASILLESVFNMRFGGGLIASVSFTGVQGEYQATILTISASLSDYLYA